jgi:hypothetical protein
MVGLLGIVLMTTVCTSVVLGSLFQRSLKREAPGLYAQLYASRPGARHALVRTGRIVGMARMILLRGYRTELAACPCARAWASWMFANGWAQIVATVLLAVAALAR